MNKLIYVYASLGFILLNSFSIKEDVLADHLCRWRIMSQSGQSLGIVQFNIPDNIPCNSERGHAFARAYFAVWGANY